MARLKSYQTTYYQKDKLGLCQCKVQRFNLTQCSVVIVLCCKIMISDDDANGTFLRNLFLQYYFRRTATVTCHLGQVTVAVNIEITLSTSLNGEMFL